MSLPSIFEKNSSSVFEVLILNILYCIVEAGDLFCGSPTSEAPMAIQLICFNFILW